MPPPPTPEFWARDGLLPSLLQPLAWVYATSAAARQAWTRPWQAPVPVVCVGNLVAGGAGKTPVVLSLAERLIARGVAVHCLSRGYGGASAGPMRVDPARHGAAEVGDEPLLLAATAPTWVARDRVAGAKAAVGAGAKLLLLDDGLQNPTLAKDLSLLVIDGGFGLGNGRVIPAGPLREPLAAGLAHTDAAVIIGDDAAGAASLLAGKPLLRARIVPQSAADLAGRATFAFAGIGRPAKFFATLEGLGARLVARRGFADHHRYAETELAEMAAAAERAGAVLVTTAKDAVRLSPEWRARVRVLPIALEWEDASRLDALLERFLRG